ncbi:MAG: plastocyanin [Psychrobacter glaciei]|jgi:plastocyanin
MLHRSLFSLLCPLLAIFYSPMGIAKEYQVQFVDSDDQPVEFAVVVNPETPASAQYIVKQPAVMDQINMQFSPMVIAVVKGQAVNFPNSDNIRHHVYSFSKENRFETKLYANKPDAPVLFEKSGLVVLGCNIHDSMVGYIFVSAWKNFAVSDGSGAASIEAIKAPRELEYWHPWSTTPNQITSYEVKQWPQQGPLIIRLTINKPQPAEPQNSFKSGFGNYRR